MDQTIFYIIIIILLTIITAILCVAFIFTLKVLKKISKSAEKFKERKEWIFMAVNVLTKLIDKVSSIYKKNSRNKSKQKVEEN